MNHYLSKKYLIISLLIHLVIFVLMSYFVRSNHINKTFLVFGAHSQKPSHAFINFVRKPVPFVGNIKKQTNGPQKEGAKIAPKEGTVSSVRQRSRGLRDRRVAKKTGAIHQKITHLEKAKTTPDIRKDIFKKPSIATVKALEEPNILSASSGTTMGVDINVVSKSVARSFSSGRLKKIAALSLDDRKKMRQEQEKMLQERQERLEKLIQEESCAREQEKKVQLSNNLEKDIKDIKEVKEEKELIVKNSVKKEDLQSDTINVVVPSDPVISQNAVDNVTPCMEHSENALAGAIESPQDTLHFNYADNANLLANMDEDLRVYQKTIQQEVGRLWRPPVGIEKGTTCRILFAVNKIGEVEHFEFVQKSKALIYDCSVKRVAKQFKFATCLWGKRFTVDFCQ